MKRPSALEVLKAAERGVSSVLSVPSHMNTPNFGPAGEVATAPEQTDKTDKTSKILSVGLTKPSCHPVRPSSKIRTFIPEPTDKTDKTPDDPTQEPQLPPELQLILDAFPGATVEIRPRTPISPAPAWPPKPQVPRDWQDLARWRALLRYARLIENKRWTVTRWAHAAGGEVRDGTLHLPVDLSCGLALAELKTHACIVGLTIEVPA